MRNPIREVDGLLPHPDLHPQRPHRHHQLGVLLAQQERDTGPSRPRCHHRAHDDDAHVIDERRPPQDILRQVDRRLPGHLFRDGVRLATR